MKKEVEQGTAPHSWGKEFVQSNYGKHGVDEAGAIYTAYSPSVCVFALIPRPVSTSTLPTPSRPSIPAPLPAENDQLFFFQI